MEETRITISLKPNTDSIVTYLNNPDADRTELMQMLTAHVTCSIGTMIKNDVPLSEALATVERAVQVGIRIYTEKLGA